MDLLLLKSTVILIVEYIGIYIYVYMVLEYK